MQSKDELLDFLKTRPHMVISSISIDGKPQSAVVGFAVTDTFEVIFGTSDKSRKAQNISNQSEVSAVIGWNMEGTIQLEGVARVLQDSELDDYLETYFDKNPYARALRDNPNWRYFVITPNWLRYTNISKYPWYTKEMTF